MFLNNGDSFKNNWCLPTYHLTWDVSVKSNNLGGGKKNLWGNFSFIKSILSFTIPPNYHVDSKAINWAVLVNIETFIYLVDTQVEVSFSFLPTPVSLPSPLPLSSLSFSLITQDF